MVHMQFPKEMVWVMTSYEKAKHLKEKVLDSETWEWALALVLALVMALPLIMATVLKKAHELLTMGMQELVYYCIAFALKKDPANLEKDKL